MTPGGADEVRPPMLRADAESRPDAVPPAPSSTELVEAAEPRGPLPEPQRPRGGVFGLVLAALGVVYGDIGTSPLYAVSGAFDPRHGGLAITEANARGFVSLVVWALITVVSLKYLAFVVRADNDGAGGVFALYGLIHRHPGRAVGALLTVLALAAGMLFGEGVITPAISVLSAIEGLTLVTPIFDHAVVPLTIVVLTGLFGIQSWGTAKVGRVFGPIGLAWFVTIAALGAREILHHPAILGALDPREGVALLLRGEWRLGLVVLGAVLLTLTGCESMYADLGHFGRRPVRISWAAVVFPALVLNYLGQGAYLARGAPIVGGSVFFSMVPKALLVPVVLLATLATVVASQALISGAFSLAAQAVALGLFPRLQIVHTHHAHEGQIYVPLVNGLLYLGAVTLVVGFRSSEALANVYGLAISGVMLSTSLTMIAITTLEWGWSRVGALAIFAPFAVIDAGFLIAKSTKLFEGGVIPIGIGLLIFSVVLTWRWGRKATFAAYSGKHTMTMERLVAAKESATHFLERNAVLMVPKTLRALTDNTPALLQLLWDRYEVLPKNLIFVQVVHRKVPFIHDERYEITTFQRSPDRGCIASVTIAFGFMEEPDVEHALEELAAHHAIDLPADPKLWSFHVSVENFLPSKKSSALRRARLRLFALLRQVSQPSYYYYRLGNNVQLSVEVMPVRLR